MANFTHVTRALAAVLNVITLIRSIECARARSSDVTNGEYLAIPNGASSVQAAPEASQQSRRKRAPTTAGRRAR